MYNVSMMMRLETLQSAYEYHSECQLDSDKDSSPAIRFLHSLKAMECKAMMDEMYAAHGPLPKETLSLLESVIEAERNRE